MDRDHTYFNCSEEHEFNYVKSLYIDENGVYNFLKEKCKTNEINYSTHAEVYTLLADAGFSRK